MCQVIEKVTYRCSHPIKYWSGQGICLFRADQVKEGRTRFHTVYFIYRRSPESCPKCQIGLDIRNRIHRRETARLASLDFLEEVEKVYSQLCESRVEAAAARYESGMKTDLEDLRTEGLADLHLQVKERIAHFLTDEKEDTDERTKIELLRALTRLPEVFDIAGLVLFFASRYRPGLLTLREMLDLECDEMLDIVRSAGLEETFKEGLARDEPLPVSAL
ncbi:hypothetical protein GGR50DRAFT_701826 [Xylaria sp. CBS 124048]|nr:hypothetical protein GGR50DRAFT_701826 [Xylaria sp. CBS 124048]